MEQRSLGQSRGNEHTLEFAMSSPSSHWHYTDGANVFGPFDTSAIRQLVDAGVIRPEHLVAREGDCAWKTLKEVSFDPAPVSTPMLPPVPQALQQPEMGPLASIGLGIAVLTVFVLGVCFWIGRPELFVVFLIVMAIKAGIKKALKP